MLGNNEVAGMLPFVSDDAGTPFAVGIIAMDDKMASHWPGCTWD